MTVQVGNISHPHQTYSTAVLKGVRPVLRRPYRVFQLMLVFYLGGQTRISHRLKDQDVLAHGTSGLGFRSPFSFPSSRPSLNLFILWILLAVVGLIQDSPSVVSARNVGSVFVLHQLPSVNGQNRSKAVLREYYHRYRYTICNRSRVVTALADWIPFAFARHDHPRLHADAGSPRTYMSMLVSIEMGGGSTSSVSL